MAFATIRGDFDLMWASYPAHPERNAAVNERMDEIHTYAPKATSCCIQMSYAFNVAGLKVPQRSYHRQNYVLRDNGWALGSCDEMEYFLAGRFGITENIRGPGGTTVTSMQNYIRGRDGILVFRGTPGREHTELWNGSRIRQHGGPDGMNEVAIFGNPRVLFWEISNTSSPDQWDIPTWLQGWWSVSDGTVYWYYFAAQGAVHYTKAKPKDFRTSPIAPANSGRVSFNQDTGKAIVTWNPRGGASTVETFTRIGEGAISGTSNRFGALWGNKVAGS